MDVDAQLLLDLCEVEVLVFYHRFQLHAIKLHLVERVVHCRQRLGHFFTVLNHVLVIDTPLLIDYVFEVLDLIAQLVESIHE